MNDKAFNNWKKYYFFWLSTILAPTSCFPLKTFFGSVLGTDLSTSRIKSFIKMKNSSGFLYFFSQLNKGGIVMGSITIILTIVITVIILYGVLGINKI